jgi:RND superfamily putative drug exporter
VFGLKVGSNGVSTLPDRFTSKRGFVEVQRNFPRATTDPVLVVVDHASDPQITSALARLRSKLAADPRFAGRGVVLRSDDGQIKLLQVAVRGDSQGPAAISAVRNLRSDVLPREFDGTAALVLVGGDTAETVDYLDSVSNPAPYVFLLVLGLTFVLLTVVFRSVVIAGTAVFLNLLSVGAAYGLLVLVFQHGSAPASSASASRHDRGLGAALPLLGAVRALDGLPGLPAQPDQRALRRQWTRRTPSSRRRLDRADHHRRGADHRRRLRGFAMGELIMFQQMGFGVAVALLIDATVIRSVILPSAMKLLGRWNWYLPSWLDWLPRLEAEGPVPAVDGTPVAS